MKHHIGEVISVYDGDFIGWTTAELLEFINKCGEYERWRMRTTEGSELVRFVDFGEEENNFRAKEFTEEGVKELNSIRVFIENSILSKRCK